MTPGQMIATQLAAMDRDTVTIVVGLGCGFTLALPFLLMAGSHRREAEAGGALARQAQIYAIAARIKAEGQSKGDGEAA